MTRQYTAKQHRNAESLVFSSLDFCVREGSYFLGFGGFFLSFSFCPSCSSKALLYFTCSGSAASEHLPLQCCWRGADLALQKRSLAGSGLPGAAWPHSWAAYGPGNLNTKAAGVYCLGKFSAPSRHVKGREEHRSHPLSYSHSDWFPCLV